jgi:hypothetical protein
MIVALARIRERRALRYALLTAALAIGIGYSFSARTGDPAVDAVERFHFVEYGAITLLFYLAWRPVADASRFILPVLAGLVVGTLEEWLQWFVPARVGEVGDIFLNLWAILCGLLFSVAVDPPRRFGLSVRPDSWRLVRRTAALTVLVFAAFFHVAHLGYEVNDAAAGTFRSAYPAQRLDDLARQRAEAWRATPPLTWSRYSQEDQYFSEGIALVRRRNQCWDSADVPCAWEANAILERFYAPVLDSPSYVSQTGHRWPGEQRDDARRRAGAGAAGPLDVQPDSVIYTWSKPLFWTVVVAVVALLLLL